MENQPISNHIAVISQHGSKASENPANGAPGPENADFANVLTAQLNAQAFPGAEPVAARDSKPAQPEKPGLELNDGRDISKDALQDFSQFGAALNALPLAHFPSVQPTYQASASAAEKIKADASVLDATKGKVDACKLELGVGVAAKESADPAKIAVRDKPLPVDALVETKIEAPKVNPDFSAHMVQMNRQEPPPSNSAVATLPAVEVRLGQPGWDAAFSQRVTWAATNNHQVAQLQLNPPNLGPVEVRITIANDQTNAVFASPHASVREAIEAALPRLREMLADSGLTMGNVNVSSQSFQQQQHQAQQGHPEGSGREDHVHDLQGALAPKGLDASHVGVTSLMLGRNGLVDIFA